MFGLFQRKSEKQNLNSKYDKLMKEAFELSKVNRTASDAKYAEADALSKRIEQMTD